MTLYLILFFLATCVVMLLAIPLVMLIAPNDWPELWANIKFWSIVVACWVGVLWAVTYA